MRLKKPMPHALPKLKKLPKRKKNEVSADYALALRDFIWEIPDGHVSMPLSAVSELFREETDGGLGLSLTELDDGRDRRQLSCWMGDPRPRRE